MVRGGLIVLNKNGMTESVIGSKKSYSTLKAMTKDELIELLKIAQHNYECVNESLFNITQHAEKLDKALDKVCDMIIEYSGNCPYDMFDSYRDCLKSCTNAPKDCWRDYLMKGDKELGL